MLEAEPLGSIPAMTENLFLLSGELWPILPFYTEMFWEGDSSDVLLVLISLTGETEENARGVVTS